jgi:protein-tyrosine phosphatase
MHVVFVCATNRCLSPLAARILGELAVHQRLRVTADSAATLGTHAGKPADDLAVAVAAARDIDLSRHTARKIGPDDFTRADLIVAFDRSDLRLLTMERPRGCPTEIRLFTSFAEKDGPSDIAYPAGDDIARYETAYESIVSGVRDILASLRNRKATKKISA